MKHPINRLQGAAPIFVIGAPRSGTTVFFEAFSRHPDLAWPSNYTGKFPTVPLFNYLRCLFDNRFYRVFGMKQQYDVRWFKKYLFFPGEAYSFWNHYTGLGDRFAKTYLKGVRARPEVALTLRNATELIRRKQFRKRFSCKLTGPTRLEYLHSAFPDAYFIHVIRDGRAVAESLLRVPFWKQGGGFDQPFWDEGLSPEAEGLWLEGGKQPIELAGLQWKEIVDIAKYEAGEYIPKDQYIEIRYEDFVTNPEEILSNVYEACGLNATALDVRSWTSKFVKKSMNKKVDSLGDETVARLEQLIGNTLKEMSYPIYHR